MAGFGFAGAMVVVNSRVLGPTRPDRPEWAGHSAARASVQLPRVRKQSDNSETGARHTRFTKPRLREKKGSEDDCRHGLFLASQGALEVVTVSESVSIT